MITVYAFLITGALLTIIGAVLKDVTRNSSRVLEDTSVVLTTLGVLSIVVAALIRGNMP